MLGAGVSGEGGAAAAGAAPTEGTAAKPASVAGAGSSSCSRAWINERVAYLACRASLAITDFARSSRLRHLAEHVLALARPWKGWLQTTQVF